ncbi:MAG: hypothetical protein WCO95_07615, partial [Actinomycetes bacterium]
MHKIAVQAEIDYEVHIGAAWRPYLDSILSSHKKVLIIAPDFIVASGNLADIVKGSEHMLFVAPDGEAQKNYATAEAVWNLLGE